MKQKPRWTLEMLTASAGGAVRPADAGPAGAAAQQAGLLLAVLVVPWGIGMAAFRYQLRRWLSVGARRQL